MGWKGLERNKLDFLLTDTLPVEISELFSFSQFYNYLLNAEQQKIIKNIIQTLKEKRALSDNKMFENKWSSKPLKYKILKGTNTYREMSILNPFSALNLFLFMECYQKDILDFFEKEHCFSIRYHKKNTELYYKNKKGKALEYFQTQVKNLEKGIIQQTGNFFRIAPFESINSFTDSRVWRLCNFKYKVYAKMDYKSCFDSIYTHAYSWIIERNVIDAKNAQNSHLFVTIDRVLQNINGRSSNGIVVGPEFSRMIAEIILQQIDNEVVIALSGKGVKYKRDYIVFRYVDDIFVFANEQSTLDQVIDEFKTCGERYLLHLNELKLTKGETPWLPKEWLDKARKLSDVIGEFFFKGTKKEYDSLPDEERFIVKPDFISVNRLKDEIAVLIKNHSEDRRTVVSFLLSALFNNISKKKEGYNLFGKNHAGKAMLLIDVAFYIYSFYPSFDQTRKMISILTYINDEIDFKNDADFNKKLRNKIEQYSFVFETGNLHDLCDWLPFFYEYKISMKIDIENSWIDTAYKVNDPIIWANILIYSRYNENLHKDLCLKLESIINVQLSKIVYSDPMMNDEFWYVLIFHNCPFLTQPVKDRLSAVIETIKNNAVSSKPSPTHCVPSYDVIIMLCSFLQLQSTAGNKPENSFFNWKGMKDFSEIVTYRTYQRTVFKRYKKNNNGLYASIN